MTASSMQNCTSSNSNGWSNSPEIPFLLDNIKGDDNKRLIFKFEHNIHCINKPTKLSEHCVGDCKNPPLNLIMTLTNKPLLPSNFFQTLKFNYPTESPKWFLILRFPQENFIFPSPLLYATNVYLTCYHYPNNTSWTVTHMQPTTHPSAPLHSYPLSHNLNTMYSTTVCNWTQCTVQQCVTEHSVQYSSV
jgi:hypothetical protein